jgi:lysophospholipase L1-like esterase
MGPQPLRRILAIAAVNLAAVLALLLALEGAARWLGAADARPFFYDPELHTAGRPFVMEHPTRGFALRPGFESAAIRVNRDGFRGHELPGDLDGRFVVLALGDSTVFGWGVRDDESWPALLQEELEAAGVAPRPLVVNAGVPSYTSRQVLLYLEELLPRLDPDLVLVGVLWNDLWFSSLDPWYPEVLVLRRPHGWRRTLSQYSALFRWIASRGAGAGGRRDVSDPRALAHYTENLEAVADSCARHGAALAFVTPGWDASKLRGDGGMPLGQVRFSRPFVRKLARRYAAALGEAASRRGVALVDHAISIAHRPPPGAYLDAIHPHPRGQRAMARDLARGLVARGLVPVHEEPQR